MLLCDNDLGTNSDAPSIYLALTIDMDAGCRRPVDNDSVVGITQPELTVATTTLARRIEDCGHARTRGDVTGLDLIRRTDWEV